MYNIIDSGRVLGVFMYARFMHVSPDSQLEMRDEIFHFEIFENCMKILKYFETPF